MLRSNLKQNSNLKHSLLAGAFLLLLVLGAKLDLDLGGLVSFTLQTLFLGLAYYYLPIKWRLAVILSYLALGILGVPVFNGGVGWSYFTSWSLGFFVGFVLAVFVPVPSSARFVQVFGYFGLLHLLVFTLGVVWVGYYAGSFNKGLETGVELLPGAVIKSAIGAAVALGVERLKASINSNN